MVHMFSAQPQPTTRSAPWISPALSGEENPPEIPRLKSWSWKSPFATADVATSAPAWAARPSSSSLASRAPRPATKTGRSAALIRCARRRTLAAEARTGWASATATGCASECTAGAAADWTSRGRLSTTVRRSFRAVRKARRVSATAVAGEWIRSLTAPTLRASASWSILKLDRTAEAWVSAVSTISGVRLLAASPIPVIALLSPQPWWVLTTPTNPDIREYASAMVAAPPSCRAAVNGTPARRRALVTSKFPLPTTPNTCPTPSSARVRPTIWATVAGAAPVGPSTACNCASGELCEATSMDLPSNSVMHSYSSSNSRRRP